MPPSTIAPPKIKGTASGVAGGYTKLSVIGKGSFGDIFLVRDTKKGGETLIMKQVQTKGLSQSEVRATKQETAVLKHVRHPFIVGYHDTFDEAGMVHIVMEYAAGGDLGRLIRLRSKEGPGGTKFTESEIKRYARQLGSALEYLHGEVHLLHRDIKPKNVFLSGNGDVRLGDFGLSIALSKSDGQATTQVGTPLYMSPELAAGKPYDRGADVWAFGCTLFECMGFQPPWHELCNSDGMVDGGMKRLEKALLNNTLNVMALRAYYSEELCEAVSKLLAKKREERLPLSKLITQLTEAPKVPASWGLSAEAQAALEAMNEAQAQEDPDAAIRPAPPRAKPTASSKTRSSKTSKPAVPPVPTVPLWGLPDWTASMRHESGDDYDDEDEDDVDPYAMGVDVHAAASVLQRSFKLREKKKAVMIQAPGEEIEPVADHPGAGTSKRVTLPPSIKIVPPGGGRGGPPSWGKSAAGGPPSWGKGTGGSAPPSWGKVASQGGVTLSRVASATGHTPKKPALKPSRVLRSAPEDLKKKARPPSPRPPSPRSASTPSKPPRKPGLKPTRVLDGFG